jgi:hypothetical protein
MRNEAGRGGHGSDAVRIRGDKGTAAGSKWGQGNRHDRPARTTTALLLGGQWESDRSRRGGEGEPTGGGGGS